MGTIAFPKRCKLHQKWGRSDFFVFFTIVRLERWRYDPPKTLSNEAVQTERKKLNCRQKINCVIEGEKCINIAPPGREFRMKERNGNLSL